MKFQQDFKTLRNKVKFDIKESKKKYYESYFVENKNKTANIWKGINSLVTLTNRSSQ